MKRWFKSGCRTRLLQMDSLWEPHHKHLQYKLTTAADMSCVYFLLASSPLWLLSSSCLFSCDLNSTYFKLPKCVFFKDYKSALFLHKCILLPVSQQYLILEKCSGLKFYLLFIPSEDVIIPSCLSCKDTDCWVICAWLLPCYPGGVFLLYFLHKGCLRKLTILHSCCR